MDVGGWRRWRRARVILLGCWVMLASIRGIVCQEEELNDADLLQLLTPQERHLYFGSSKHVPSFSIVTPDLLPRVRRRRSVEEANFPEQMTLQALNQTFNFTLWPSRNLLADNFVMLLRRDNYTDIFDEVWEDAGCFYQGEVVRNGFNTTSSDSVAVGLCGGMRGFITSKDEYFTIAPLPQRFHKRSTDGNVPHLIWQRRNHAKTVCRHHHSDSTRKRRSSYLPYFPRDTNGFFRRERRQGSFEDPIHLYIETAVFVDRDLYKHMQINFPADTEKEVARIVLTLVNAVEHLYNDASLGYPVQFVLKRLEILASDPPALVRPYDIDHFLTSFCKWQRGENPSSDADPFHWDHALILTGLDLYVVNRNGKISNQVVGLAPVAGMCTRSSSCTVNEGRHFESVYVVAHEIGHNLGMRHDGPQADNDCDPGSYIMSPTLGSGKITWSPCSRRYLEMFLDTSQSRCLRDSSVASSHLDHGADGRLPGERFDADNQCVLKYGRGSYHAPQQPMADVCRDLHCRREHYTWTSHPALEGTKCGDRMWCRTGRCIHRDAPIPGFEDRDSHESGWGRWSPFTDCASGCLYGEDGRLSSGSTGIMLASRRCETARTHPQCLGVDKRYIACNAVQQCSSVRRTTIQEYADEICARASEVDGELTGKGYQSISSDPERACSVWCYKRGEGSKSRGWFFPDGTVCQLEGRRPSGGAYCIGGRCQEFSCDPHSVHRQEDTSCPDPLDIGSGVGLVPSSASGSGTGLAEDLYSLPISRDWSRWTPSSPCRFGCLAPARGLQLVTRECRGGNTIAGSGQSCLGLTTSVRLCRPDKPDCPRLKTPFEYATSVCSKYLQRVSGLSGLGMQLSSSRDDPDRPCKVACQDERVSYRFYMVNGEDGWFPSGSDCSRGIAGKVAYCLGGRCVDFGEDDTPLYRPEYNLHRFERLFKRSLMINSTRIGSSLEESLLREIIEKLNLEANSTGTSQEESMSGVDFSNPVHVSEVPLSNSTLEDLNMIPVEAGSKGPDHTQPKPRETRLPLRRGGSENVWLPSTGDSEGKSNTDPCTALGLKTCVRNKEETTTGSGCSQPPCDPINQTIPLPANTALSRWFSKILHRPSSK